MKKWCGYGMAILAFAGAASSISRAGAGNAAFEVAENDERITIVSPTLEVEIRKRGYVSGVAGGSFLDKKTGFRDAGFGLDIVDWVMEPGSDEAWRDELPDHMVYHFTNLVHGKRPKRSIEGPQICTKAGAVDPKVIRGSDFVAVRTRWQYTLAAPGKRAGSQWEQTIVFLADKRYFLSCDKITSVNRSDAMFLRVDMPGHIKHNRGDTFSAIYLSYGGKDGEGRVIPSSEFFENFPPDTRFNYRRDRDTIPKRFIRAYRLRDPDTGRDGPWLAGMTLEPSVVHEAWCHQRGYVCMIEEFGGRPIAPRQSFSAAFVVGFFDSIEEMNTVFDRYRENTRLELTDQGWTLTKRKQ